MRLFVPALLFAISFQESAAAQEVPPPIVVTGAGLEQPPAAVAYGIVTIDRGSFERAASGRIDAVLGEVAGLQQFRRSDSRSANPSAQGLTLRGLGGNASSRTLVLLDGVPLSDPFFGFVPLNAIDPNQLSRIRITRGGGAGSFGTGAVAGMVELESASAEVLGLAGGEAFVDDRGETEVSGWLAPKLGSGFAIVTGRWERGAGFWTTPPEQRVQASVPARYRSWSTGLRAAAPLGDGVELQARALVYRDERTLRFAGADSRSAGEDASLRIVGRGRWQFELLGYVQARDFGNVVVSATSFRRTLDQRKTPSTGSGGRVEVRPPAGGGHALRLGADLRIVDGMLEEEPLSSITGNPTARRRAGGRNADIGAFVEDDWSAGPLTLTFGLRADRWSIAGGFFRESDPQGRIVTDLRFPDRSGWSGSGRGGAVLALGSGLFLRAAGYSGLRQPTLNELYRPFVVFPVTTRANAGLRNERLVGFEGGLDLVRGRLSLSLTGFDNRVSSAIANVTIAANLRERQNLDAVRARGVEASAAYAGRGWDLRGDLSLTSARVEASGIAAPLDGLRPAQTPKWSASLSASWHPRPGWTISGSGRHVGSQFEDDLNLDVLPAVTTVDGYLEMPVGPASLVLRVENVGNVRIVTRNQAGSLDLGAPRTIWAGIRLRG